MNNINSTLSAIKVPKHTFCTFSTYLLPVQVCVVMSVTSSEDTEVWISVVSECLWFNSKSFNILCPSNYHCCVFFVQCAFSKFYYAHFSVVFMPSKYFVLFSLYFMEPQKKNAMHLYRK